MTSMSRTLLPMLAFLIGCGASAAHGNVVELEETRIVARRSSGGELELDSYDASQLFARALELDRARDCEGAVALYDRIVSEFGGSRFVSPSLYNAGLCLQGTDQLARAVDHYT